MKLQLAVVILLIGSAYQQCSIGCLMCSPSNQCLLCDITNNYFLNGNTCSISTQTNCLMIAQNGNCGVCRDSFYLDVNSQRCLAVTTSNVVASCLTYNTGQVCTMCSENFFISAARCMAVNNTVSNCVSYSANGVCVSCKSGFVQSNDFTQCVEIPANNNCLVYTFIGCRSCNVGFLNNPNFYFTNFASVTYVNWFLANIVQSSSSWQQLNVCQPVTVNNCALYAAFNICNQCNSGFYLKNGNCFAFPLPVIFGCLTYSSLTTCSSCYPGMFLAQNVCQNNVIILNCLTYSGTATSTTCVQCTSNFFLQNNICVARSISLNIQNCQINAINADLCGTCNLNFILTNDSRACLTPIANCNKYSASNFMSSILQCSLCNNGFFMTSSGMATSCSTGTVQFCLTYAVNANTCAICTNGYYLSGNLCLQHVTIKNCLQYDPSKAHFCSTCSSGFYNFAYTTVCVQTTLRSGCVSYSFDGNNCVTCQPGFYILNGGCSLIPTAFANCNIFSGIQCTLCNPGYMVNSLPILGSCTLPLDYITASSNSPCAVLQPLAAIITPTWQLATTTVSAPITCLTCNNYMYGYNPQRNEAICVLASQLVLNLGFVSVSQCSRYGLNFATNPTIVCMECSSGFFLTGYQALGPLTTSTSCISSCQATSVNSNAVIPDDFLGFVNICIPFSAVGAFTNAGTCQRFARFQSQSLGLVTVGSIATDFRCIIAAPSTTTLPTVFMQFSADTAGAGGSFYTFEIPSQTTPVTSSTDFSTAYSNTLDASSSVPNVFNYHGILPGITSQAFAITTANLVNNHLQNCDIIVNYPVGYAQKGWAFDTSAAAGLLYTAAQALSYYSCFRCNFGYQLTYIPGGTPATNPVFPSCTQMNNCASSNTVYGGLPNFLNSVFSCHVCSQVSGLVTYPSIWIETDGTNTGSATWGGWSLNGIYGSATTIAQANHGFRCAIAPALITITDHAVLTSSVFNNCAAFGYITKITTFAPTVASDAQRTVCLACAANFFPSYLVTVTPTTSATNILTVSKLPNFLVIGCTASANCDTSSIIQYNSCGKCRSDLENALVPSYFAYMDYTLANCYQSITQNCFMLQSTPFSNTANNNPCFVCKAGFFKNVDGICESYRIPNQLTSTGLFTNAYYTTRVFVSNAFVIPATTTVNIDAQILRLHYLLSFKRLQYGVNACNSGWVTAPANPWAPRVCVLSSYIYNNTGTYPVSSVFINNCVRYNVTLVGGRNICGGCNTGFIPTIDGLSCVVNTVLANCMFSQTGTNTGLCYQCNANFMNVNGQCVSTTIPNCATYVNNLWTFTNPGNLQCASCLNGFVRSNDALKCTQGSILNCISYNQGQPSQCNNCTDGFVMMTLNSVTYCYPIPASLNCALLQDTSPNSGANLATVSCARCNADNNQAFGARNWLNLGFTTQPQSICMPFNAINNCVTYDQNNALIRQNTFTCTQCAAGFWYSSANFTCVPRVNMPSQCTAFAFNSDVCTACAAGTFLTTNGLQCVQFPNGIFNCNQYSSDTTCIQCNAGTFLSNNACIVSTLINNCAVYSANFTCSSCNPAFFLMNQTSCVTPVATNCLSFTSINICATCAVGFGLLTTNGATSCVSVSLPNCVNATLAAPFTCFVCSAGFYVNTAGVCVVVPQIIANCLIYDTASTCMRCSVNSVLNVARTSCNSTYYASLVDPNCNQSFLMSNPACLDCALGSFFVNGTCTACSNNTLASGCLSCNPTNNDVCLVCAPQFYMNAQGNCIATNQQQNPLPFIPQNTNATISVNKAIALSFALVTLYFERF